MTNQVHRVLVLKFGDYREVLEKILIKGIEAFSWNVGVVSTSSDTYQFKSFLKSKDNFFMAPNFRKKQSWEDDNVAVAEIDKIIEESERIVGIPVSRIILSEERNIGRAYSRSSYYWPEGPEAKAALKNNDIQYKVIRRAFFYAYTTLKQFQPELCLSCPVSGLLNSSFYFVSRYMNIPYLACMVSSVDPCRHFWFSGWEAFNSRLDDVYVQYVSEKRAPSHESLAKIFAFEASPVPSLYYKNLWKNKLYFISFKSLALRITNRIICRIMPLIKRTKVTDAKPILPYIFHNVRQFLIQFLQKKDYKYLSNDDLKNINYIYYPMHLDPEMVLNINAPMWHHQLTTLKLLSSNLPYNYKLIVREHRFNIGKRSNSYLKELVSYPNIILVNAFDDQYKYIKNAKLIVTVNGTTGFEGLLLKKKVITLDRASYNITGLTFPYRESGDLGRHILKTLSTRINLLDYEKKLAIYVDSDRETSFPLNSDLIAEINYMNNLVEIQKRVWNEVYSGSF